MVTPYLVNPVNDRDIKLPTDGFHTPTVLEQLIGNRESRGTSGETRPMPRTEDEAPANPKIGYDADMLAPTQGRNADETKPGKKSRKQDREAQASATPGFSLN